MAQHELKTDPAAFQAVKAGLKPFEIRYDDRDYQIGDHLHLREYEPATGYTGDALWVTVGFMLLGDQYGLELGHAALAITPRWRSEPKIRKRLAVATSDPGHFVGYKGERSMGEWMADAVIAALRQDGAFAPLPMDVATARAQGRSEALAILLETSAETFPDDHMGNSQIADTGDYSTHWDEPNLRALLKTDDTAWSLMQKAEGEYWHNLGVRTDTKHLNDRLEDLVANGIHLPAELTPAMWAAAGDAVVKLQQRGHGHHDKIVEGVWEALKAFTPEARNG